jgi:hypothetical protein
MSTSKIASFAMARSLGIVPSVVEIRLFFNALVDEWILSYHSTGMNSIRFGGRGRG